MLHHPFREIDDLLNHVKKKLKDYSTTEDEDEEEEGKLKREAEEGSVKVKQEPVSPPPLRRRRG